MVVPVVVGCIVVLTLDEFVLTVEVLLLVVLTLAAGPCWQALVSRASATNKSMKEQLIRHETRLRMR
jgi:hypothetical protein